MCNCPNKYEKGKGGMVNCCSNYQFEVKEGALAKLVERIKELQKRRC